MAKKVSRSIVVKIDDDVAKVLADAEIAGCELRLVGQLDRKLYLRVADALKLLGGKWNRKAQAHVFPSDVTPLLSGALQDGSVEDRKKTLQAYDTPPELARELVDMAGVRKGHRSLEPSAGRGSIARALRDVGAKVECVEINEEAVYALRADEFDVHHVDFLGFCGDGEPWDRIVMNPPFTRGQAIQHVTHALSLLADDGVLVAVMPASVPTGRQKSVLQFRELVGELEGRFSDLPEASFKTSGTCVHTVALIVDRRS